MKHTLPPCYYRLSIKALIHNEAGEFLLVREENGLWEFPGGGLDHGEDIHEGLKREIREEMGLEVVDIAPEPAYFFVSESLNGNPIVNALYDTRLKNYDFTPSGECQEIGFFSVEEAKKLTTYPNIQVFLSRYNPKKYGNI